MLPPKPQDSSQGLGPQPQQPQADVSQETAGPNGELQATPEEQAMYDKVVAFGTLALHSDKFLPNALEMIKSSPNVITGMAMVAASIVHRLIQKSKEQGVAIPGEVILHAGSEIVEQVVEVAEASGVPPVAEQDMEKIFFTAADQLREMMEGSGDLDGDGVAEDVEIFKQMEASGELEQVLAQMGQQASEPAPVAPSMAAGGLG